MTDTRTAPKQVFLALSERCAVWLDEAVNNYLNDECEQGSDRAKAMAAIIAEIAAQLAKAPEPLIKDAIPFDDGGSPTVKPKRKAPAKSRGKQIGEAMAKAAKEKLDGPAQ